MLPAKFSRTITVRVTESRDAWTTRVLVVGGRGKPEDMEAYDEMQLLYNKSKRLRTAPIKILSD